MKTIEAGKLPQLVTVGGFGRTDYLKSASWDSIRDEIYRGCGGVWNSESDSTASLENDTG